MISPGGRMGPRGIGQHDHNPVESTLERERASVGVGVLVRVDDHESSGEGRRGQIEGYIYLGLLTLLVGWGIASVLERTTASILPGVLAFWALLGLMSALLAPGFGYLLVWPVIVGSILLLMPDSIVARIGTILVIAVLHVPWTDFLLQFSMPRPGNPDSELLPLGGLALAFAVLSLLVVRTAVGPTAGPDKPSA